MGMNLESDGPGFDPQFRIPVIFKLGTPQFPSFRKRKKYGPSTIGGAVTQLPSKESDIY